jgi:hypothetical protein
MLEKLSPKLFRSSMFNRNNGSTKIIPAEPSAANAMRAKKTSDVMERLELRNIFMRCLVSGDMLALINQS